MLFYTPEFLVFSIVLIGALSVIHRSEPRKVTLLLASYVFYMWWNPAFVLLIVFSTGIDYTVGRAMARTDVQHKRRMLLVVSLVSNLGLLGWFKYAGLFSNSLLGVMRACGMEPGWVAINVTLPVGISFYTFQTLSYTIDLYRGSIEESRSPLDFALFVAFFPQLVAGPIVRAAEFLPELKRPVTLRASVPAAALILRGMAKKVLVADNIGAFADGIFSQPDAWPSIVIWLATICFAIQIYCDFSGYSDIAIGIAWILGFQLPQNFDYPYFARNPSQFWRKWHMSLSRWLRDYLYISLGGNRGSAFMTHRNLMITMLLGGLWHGASWNFLLWGFLHGALLIVHRIWSSRRAADAPVRDGLVIRLLSIVLLQYFVLLTWIAFRVRDFDDMWTSMTKFVVFDFSLALANTGLGALALFSTLGIIGIFSLLHFVSHRADGIDRAISHAPRWQAGLVFFLAGICFFLGWPLSDSPFIYFQF